MSYQVIALKWRPQNFQNMIGQKHISQTLTNALKAGRLPQAILFTGPRGTGKTSTARILAKSLRCQNLQDFTPCGTCSDCQDIALGRSLDVVEIDGASNNGVDSIRELRDSVSFRPSSGDKKVYIIDEVHMLSISAFNALLKTLEEPPEHVVFILATTEVHKIPKTILSRCHRFDFRKISVQDMADYLENICTSEGVKFEKEALWSIARQGQGSVRDSLSFLDQVITYSEKNVSYENVRESLGLTDRRLLTQILQNVVTGDKDGVMKSLDSLFSSGTDINVIAEDLLEELKNLLVVKTSKSAKDYLDLPEAEISILAEIAQKVSEAHIHLLFDMMLKLTQDLYRTQDQKTVLEVGVLKLCLYPKIVDLEKNQSPVVATPEGADAKVKYHQEAARKLKIESKTIHLVPQQSVSKPERPAAAPVDLEIVRQDTVSAQSSAPVQAKVEMKNFAEDLDLPQVQTSQRTQLPEINEQQKKWSGFVEKILRLNVKVGATLKNCHYKVTENTVEISAPEKLVFIQADLAREDFHRMVENYVRTFLGPQYTFTIIDGNSGLTAPPSTSTLAKEKAEFQKKHDEAVFKMVQESEVIQNLKKTFKNVEIISVKESES